MKRTFIFFLAIILMFFTLTVNAAGEEDIKGWLGDEAPLLPHPFHYYEDNVIFSHDVEYMFDQPIKYGEEVIRTRTLNDIETITKRLISFIPLDPSEIAVMTETKSGEDGSKTVYETAVVEKYGLTVKKDSRYITKKGVDELASCTVSFKIEEKGLLLRRENKDFEFAGFDDAELYEELEEYTLYLDDFDGTYSALLGIDYRDHSKEEIETRYKKIDGKYYINTDTDYYSTYMITISAPCSLQFEQYNNPKYADGRYVWNNLMRSTMTINYDRYDADEGDFLNYMPHDIEASFYIVYPEVEAVAPPTGDGVPALIAVAAVSAVVALTFRRRRVRCV